MDPQPDFRPVAGTADELSPGLRRVLAPNPSPMTYRGTNTYLLGFTDLAVIDPGPDNPVHLQAILAAVQPGQQITHILVTHAHIDHSPLARALSASTGAPILGFGSAEAGRSEAMTLLAAEGLLGGGEGVDHAFAPDITLAHGETVEGAGWQVRALHTPGHMANHLSFAWGDILFSGDLVMGWASSLVSPPDGDLTDFMASLRTLSTERWSTFHAGHGAPVTQPMDRIEALLKHRLGREASILEHLTQAPATAAELAAKIYTDTPTALLGAAQRNVLSHLIDMTQKSWVAPEGPLSAKARFSRL
ncbi:MBL fold metallo-hydrolase [Primorskyibacter sp. 2E233]|uniref:MBL fold metallo-hydrolase n=1 Tax=Primorskyibacter sp. 2E233 TaxID=3413431 RepID=UPI003BF36E93